MIPIKKSNSKQVYEFCRDIYEKLPEKDELDMLIFKNFGSHNGLEDYFTQQDRAFLKLMMADYSTLLKVKEKITSVITIKSDFVRYLCGYWHPFVACFAM